MTIRTDIRAALAERVARTPAISVLRQSRAVDWRADGAGVGVTLQQQGKVLRLGAQIGRAHV